LTGRWVGLSLRESKEQFPLHPNKKIKIIKKKKENKRTTLHSSEEKFKGIENFKYFLLLLYFDESKGE
jgi:hypothetical protein